MPPRNFKTPSTRSDPPNSLAAVTFACSCMSETPSIASTASAIERPARWAKTNRSLTAISRSGNPNRFRISITGMMVPCALITPITRRGAPGSGVTATARTTRPTLDKGKANRWPSTVKTRTALGAAARLISGYVNRNPGARERNATKSFCLVLMRKAGSDSVTS